MLVQQRVAHGKHRQSMRIQIAKIVFVASPTPWVPGRGLSYLIETHVHYLDVSDDGPARIVRHVCSTKVSDSQPLRRMNGHNRKPRTTRA